MHPEDKALLDANVRKVVGLAALRRLQRLVNESQEDDRCAAAFARHVLLAVGLGAFVVTLLCWTAPESVIGTLRAVAGIIR